MPENNPEQIMAGNCDRRKPEKDNGSRENPIARASFDFHRSWSVKIRMAISGRLPYSLKRRLRVCALLPLDAVDLLLRRRKQMVPPRYLSYAGDGDFEATGNEFFSYFKQLGGLKPDEKVLDVGCGIGRMARPLTQYLTTGTYEGIDVMPVEVHWCQRHITNLHRNFRFQIADVCNPMYNPRGRFRAEEYRFPFEDSTFDFVFLTSVFTHLFKEEMENYLSEIVRTLRPGGRCFITFFLLNDASRKLIEQDRSAFGFKFNRKGTLVDDALNPAKAVAFEEDYIRGLYKRLGLEIGSVNYGCWCGRDEYLTYQDIVIARRLRS